MQASLMHFAFCFFKSPDKSADLPPPSAQSGAVRLQSVGSPVIMLIAHSTTYQ